MGRFSDRLEKCGRYPLISDDISTIQVNLGFLCNQSCLHCHVKASSARTETMTWTTMEAVLRACAAVAPARVDLTGGAPEMNPEFRRFVRAIRELGRRVQVRTNLTILLEAGFEELPRFFRDQRVELVASLPCYTEENVDAQRGTGVHAASIAALKRLNGVGYGVDPDLPLDLVYNPGGPFLPPPQSALEQDYRAVLQDEFGVFFSRLLTIANMPLGRFQEDLDRQGKGGEYRALLEENFNPETIDGLMCRHQISIGWDGTLYDCDFNLALERPVDVDSGSNTLQVNFEDLVRRRVVMDDHCFGCTAGCGSSCGGALAEG